jgi:restriction endonuclease HindI-like protein
MTTTDAIVRAERIESVDSRAESEEDRVRITGHGPQEYDDWLAVKKSIRANLRVTVKRILRKYGYPPDKQEKATQAVLQRTELLSRDWRGITH